jgi:hypothetical protein
MEGSSRQRCLVLVILTQSADRHRWQRCVLVSNMAEGAPLHLQRQPIAALSECACKHYRSMWGGDCVGVAGMQGVDVLQRCGGKRRPVGGTPGNLGGAGRKSVPLSGVMCL